MDELRIKREASRGAVFSDATITVPLAVQPLPASGKKRKSVLVFDWKDGGLERRYEGGGVSGLTTFFPQWLPGAKESKY